jgi:hypothetical protein
MIDTSFALYGAHPIFIFFEVVDPPPEQDFLQGLEAARAAYFKRPRYRRRLDR